MKIKLLVKILGVLVLSCGLLYAANTIRVTIPETTNDTSGPKSYDAQELYIAPDSMLLINKDNDDLFQGDYFSGFYRDTMYGPFEMQYNAFDGSSSTGVYVTSIDATSDCVDQSTHTGYRLEGYSYSPDFGAMDFNSEEVGEYVYLCVPKLENSDTSSYLSGNAYSKLIGLQHFGGIEFDAYVDRDSEHSSEARYVNIEGVTSSQNENTSNEDFDNDVRIIGNIEKSSLRKNILQQVYASILNAPINNGTGVVSSAGSSQWNNGVGGGTILRNGSVLYFGNLEGNSVTLNGSSDISGIKTLIVEGGDIFINSNIIDSAGDSDMLGLIAVSKTNSSGNVEGGNIIIDSDVTDIHASLYADRSILSFAEGDIADGDTPNQSLANQLYIQGSIFSENTTGGGLNSPYKCPFFVQGTCTQQLARKYDLSYLRRYILVSEEDDGDPTTIEAMIPDNSGSESSTVKAGYESYPLIVEYNPAIQTTPPPFFGE